MDILPKEIKYLVGHLVENDMDILHKKRNHIVRFSFIRVYNLDQPSINLAQTRLSLAWPVNLIGLTLDQNVIVLKLGFKWPMGCYFRLEPQVVQCSFNASVRQKTNETVAYRVFFAMVDREIQQC